MTGWVVAFPMYELAGLEAAHDVMWSALQSHLARAGCREMPDQLARHLHHEHAWAHPRLLLGQACEYPLARSVATSVRLVATPKYKAVGCLGATYRSAIIVRQADEARDLRDLRGRRCVANEPSSNSGMNLLRAALAPVAKGRRFFESVEFSGSHRRSVERVVEGEADVAAIDCVTLAHIARLDPALAETVRILDWTPSSPSLPFITGAASNDETLRQLRTALHALTKDPVMDYLRAVLLLDGFDLEPESGFTRVLQLERTATELGYSKLH